MAYQQVRWKLKENKISGKIFIWEKIKAQSYCSKIFGKLNKNIIFVNI